MNRIAITLLAGVAVLGFASASQAADLIVDAPIVEPGVVQATGGNWDGVFIGGFVGYTTGDVDATDGDDDIFDINGYQIGAAIGANFTVADGIVAGVVADLAWTNIEDDDFTGEFNANWTGSLRGRLGFDGGAFMPYLTAGLAVAGTEYADEENTHIGWTAGAGVEFAVSQNMSLDLQYRYSDYGPQEYFGADYEGQTHAITAGLNFKF